MKVNAGIALMLMSCFVAEPLYGLGVEYSLSDIYKYYPTAIDKIITCGNWDSKPDYGKYRITHASMYAQSFLYITKIKIDETIAIYKSIDILSISEYNNDHAEVSLTSLKCIAMPSGIKVTAIAYYGHEDVSRNVSITILNSKFSYVLEE